MAMIRRILIGLVAALAVLVVTALLIVQSDSARKAIERRAAAWSGREVSIGSLDIDLGRCLRVEAQAVRIGNPAWAEHPYLVDARLMRVCIAWWPLLRGKLHVVNAALVDAEFGLERDAEGRATWAVGAQQKEERGEAPPLVNNVELRNVRVRFRDAGLDVDLELRAEGGTPEQPDIAVRAEGKVRDAEIHAVLHSPAALPSPEAPVVVSAALVIGRSTAAAAGRLRSLGIEDIDLQLSIAGDNFADFNRLKLLPIPKTPPYALRARVRNERRDTWHTEDMAGRVGDSDVAGRFTTVLRERPYIEGEVNSKLFDLDDVLPLFGAAPKTGPGETAAPEQEAAKAKKKDKVLPQEPFVLARLTALDADVHFVAEQIRRPDAVPINALAGRLRVDDGTVHLEPLDFEIAGGKVSAELVLEGRARPPRAAADFDVRGIRLAKLLPNLSGQNVAVGILFGRAHMKARGDSVAALLANADGDLTLMVNGGEMSAILLEAAGLDIAEVVKFLTVRDKPVPLRCAILDVHLDGGVAKTELFVIDTVDTVFIGEGTVDFGKEHLDVTLHPRPKDRSPLALRSPLHVEGPFADPSAGVKSGRLLARGGAALALGLVNPLLAILPLIETGPGEDSDCGEFTRRVRATPQKDDEAVNEREKRRAAGGMPPR